MITRRRDYRSAPPSQWRAHAPLVIAALLLATAMSVGGNAQGKGDTLVHVVAIIALGVAVGGWGSVPLGGLQKTAFGLLLAAIGVAALQLLPVPAGLFEQVPGRRLVLAEMEVAGFAPGWLPLSLDPTGTRRAVLALAAFLAMWMLCTCLTADARIRLLKLAAAIAVPMALFGFAQASRKLDTTGANGLFENRNHYATLMAMMLPLAIASARDAMDRRRPAQALAWHAAGVAILLAAALSFSRAGVVLAVLAALASLLLVAPRVQQATAYRRSAIASLAVAAAAAAFFARERLAERFGSSLLGDLRWRYFINSWEVLKTYLPWGSGPGSFRQVYAQGEPFASLGEFTFANHAHNDLLQNTIEAGIPGLLLMLGFVWIVLWAGARLVSASTTQDIWQRAALVTVSVPLLHSLVDYPLRTFACSIPLALALAVLLARPAIRRRSGAPTHGADARLP